MDIYISYLVGRPWEVKWMMSDALTSIVARTQRDMELFLTKESVTTRKLSGNKRITNQHVEV